MAKDLHNSNKLREPNGLPEAFYWDNMEQGIVSRIPQSDVKRPIVSKSLAKSSRTKIMYLLIALLLILVGFVTCNYLKTSKHLTYSKASKINQDLVTAKKTNNSLQKIHQNPISNQTIEQPKNSTNKEKEASKEASIKENEDVVLKDSKSKNLASEMTPIIKSSRAASADYGITTIKKKKDQHPKALASPQPHTPTQKSIIQTLQNSLPKILASEKNEKPDQEVNLDTDLALNNSKELSNTALSKGNKDQNKPTLDKIANLNQLDFKIEHSHKDRIPNITAEQTNKTESLSSSEIQPTATTNKWLLELGLGMTDWKPYFNGSPLADKKTQLETGITSYGANLRLAYKLNDTWSISTGLSYQSLESHLNYREEELFLDTVNVLLRQVNAFSGEVVSESHENKIQENIKFTYALTYNQYKNIAIPLMLHKCWTPQARLSFSTGIGLKYQLQLETAGYTIIPDSQDEWTYEVIDLAENNPYTSQNSISLMTDIAMHYQLSNRIHAGIRLMGAYSTTDLSMDPSYSFRPMSIAGDVVLGYRF